jgi:hypothetical protein
MHIAMSNINFKGLAKRGAAFALAVGFLSGIALYAAPAITFADALNPLTERTLLLSSSSPGFHYLDAAGNTTYAAPNSGPNGKQTGETFSFKVSTDSVATGKTLKAFTLQYCTTAAGFCTAPGNNTGDADPNDDGSTADSTRESNATSIPLGRSDLDTVGTFTDAAGSTPAAGQFVVLVNGVASTGWTMASINAESENAAVNDANLTGKNNLIRLTNATGTAPTFGQTVQITFKASSSAYITNPGYGAFFVKINTYDSATVGNLIPATPAASNTHIVDGGVTVANVMTDSIQIQTKVLETMAFSVGTHNPDVDDPTVGGTVSGVGHGSCDAIPVNNPLKLGLSGEEYSLRVDRAFDAHSYWRLSSNSSNGATVYYSGYTLSNTVGDQINAIGTTAAMSHPGTEQFGLAYDGAADTPDTNGGANNAAGYPSSQTPAPLAVYNGTGGHTDYASGGVAGGDPGILLNGGDKFAFNTASDQIPEVLATENTDVIDCATGKMRYVANIGASTPAGIYTAAINYLAAPQY